MSETVALALYSGGLDSILACRLVARQGIRVIGLKFVSPFFDYDLLERQDAYVAEVQRKYGIEVVVVDVTTEYFELLRAPVHGFGSVFNPCIDCKIFMLRQAKARMAEYDASFLITGEVMGQRPMSQRRDSLRVIERDSDCDGFLLRPLSAKLLKETVAEEQGLVDRSLLYGISGRGRGAQINLAREFELEDYPSPAGGCLLTDKLLGKRVAAYYEGIFTPGGAASITAADMLLLFVGRQYLLFDQYWFVVGRRQDENEQLLKIRQPGDIILRMKTRPGPIGLLRCAKPLDCLENQEVISAAAGLVIRFGKKVDGATPPAELTIDTGKELITLHGEPLADTVSAPWKVL